MSLPTPEDVMDYWFGSPAQPLSASQQFERWFGSDAAQDNALRERFGPLLAAAEAGELNPWTSAPLSLLALIIVLDQFSRNLYRGSAKAFSNDSRGLALARLAVDKGWDQQLLPIQRMFVYLPFEHSEELDHQRQAVALFEQLEAQVSPSEKERFAVFTDYARRHQDVVERFGRFPHRNDRLGRQSTPEEEAFLATPGSSFG
ncbi:MAG: DUF924 family protein [Candidatus Sericytochromatia bacterium]